MKNTFSYQLGDAIRQRRNYMRFDLAELAAKSGLSIGHISNIERGQRCPTVEALLRIAKALQCPASLLIDVCEI